MRTSRTFTPEAAQEIRALLLAVRRSPRAQQTRLRQQIRDRGFYISDFARPQSGFASDNFDQLIDQGTIQVKPSQRAR
jgi:hypothetical protein